MDFELIKQRLIALAAMHNLTDVDLDFYDEERDEFDWHINWKRDLNESFGAGIARLQASLDLYDKGLAAGDMLAAQAGLLRAGIYAHNLMSFFDALRHDLSKAVIDSRFNWPTFPEGYKIPPHYGYEE
ncbi:hypothetical protein PTE30175_05341 [Pandoraea terrae]|uniref:Uncharacterized protein n=2 Tax=Pandoraea terrae TaxID=1537710 RepID=A0A5E4ZCJ2_9BURK|nr:hypothetical protein PTE30175_05341 [Pandoraea terrae]